MGLGAGLLDLLLPLRCPLCGELGAAPCQTCRSGLTRADPVRVEFPDVGECRSVLSYEGAARRMVAGIKYRNDRTAIGWFAQEMSALCQGLSVDTVTWIPASEERRNRLGVDHGQCLARALARGLGVPARDTMLRVGRGEQTRRGGAERRRGPGLRAARSVGPQLGAVLVVDDIVTTGGSLSEAGRELRRVGLSTTSAVTVARTPLAEISAER